MKVWIKISELTCDKKPLGKKTEVRGAPTVNDDAAPNKTTSRPVDINSFRMKSSLLINHSNTTAVRMSLLVTADALNAFSKAAERILTDSRINTTSHILVKVIGGTTERSCIDLVVKSVKDLGLKCAEFRKKVEK